MYTVLDIVCENNCSHIVVYENNCSHIARETQCLNTYFCRECRIKQLKNNHQSTEPWQVWPPNALGKLALGASEVIF